MSVAQWPIETIRDEASQLAALQGDLDVLIVEDDEADAYLIERALSDLSRVRGVVRAEDGVEALELLANGFEPGLAIVDLQMPRKNGFSLLVEMGCLGCQFPIVVLTSSTARADAVRSKLRGAGKVLAKPDTVEELRTLLAGALNPI